MATDQSRTWCYCRCLFLQKLCTPHNFTFSTENTLKCSAWANMQWSCVPALKDVNSCLFESYLLKAILMHISLLSVLILAVVKTALTVCDNSDADWSPSSAVVRFCFFCCSSLVISVRLWRVFTKTRDKRAFFANLCGHVFTLAAGLTLSEFASLRATYVTIRPSHCI